MNYTIKKRDLVKYLWMFLVLSIILLLQLNIDFTIKTALSVVLIALSLIRDIGCAMFIILAIMPVATEISLFGGVSLTIIIVSLNAIKYLILKKMPMIKSELKKKWYILIFALLFYSFAVFGFTGMSEQLVYTIKLFVYLVLIEGYISECTDKYKMNGGVIFSSIVRMLGIGIMIAFICLIISGGQVSSDVRFSFSNYATTNNTGIQSSFVVIGLILSRYLKSNKKIDYLIILFCCIVSIATQSRTAILMLVADIIMYIISTVLRGRLVQALLMAISLAVSLIALLQIPIVNTYYDSINGRFQVEDISHGRYEIWGKTMDQMKSNEIYTLFGAGDYYNLDFTFGKRNTSIEAHNFVIETWVIYGVLGMLILVALLWAFIKENVFTVISANASVQRCLYVFAPTIILMLGLLYSHHFIGRGNSILFISSFIPIACSKTKGIVLKKVDNDNEK